jgi:hypothetical protein
MESPLRIPELPRGLRLTVAWAWTLLAGGGGLVLLVMRGPLPLTNGWFALLSGIAACPLTGSLLSKYTRVRVSGRAQFAAAALLFLAGRVALALHGAAASSTVGASSWDDILL